MSKELEKQRAIFDSWQKKGIKDKSEALIGKIGYCLNNSEWNKRQKLENIESLIIDGGAFECRQCSNVQYMFHRKWSAIYCDHCNNEIVNNQI